MTTYIMTIRGDSNRKTDRKTDIMDSLRRIDKENNDQREVVSNS